MREGGGQAGGGMKSGCEGFRLQFASCILGIANWLHVLWPKGNNYTYRYIYIPVGGGGVGVVCWLLKIPATC